MVFDLSQLEFGLKLVYIVLYFFRAHAFEWDLQLGLVWGS
jgi:hypothetical protein